MQITEVRIRMATNQNAESKLRANASVVFDGMFVIHELRVVEGVNGLFVAMPRRKTAEGQFKDLAHPITAEAREVLASTVLTAFMEAAPKQSEIA